MTYGKCHWCNCSLPRGSYRDVFKRGRYMYAECRSQLSCFNRVIAQRDAMRHIGRQMYNTFYNIAQRTQCLHEDDPRVFGEMRDGWDAARKRTGF